MLGLLIQGVNAVLLAGPPVVRGFARFFGRRKRTAAPVTVLPAGPTPVPASWARYQGARPEPLGWPTRTVLAVDGHDLFTAADYEALFALCTTLGLSVDALMILMRHESHLDAVAWNGIAGGLVQITKDAGVPGYDTLERVAVIPRMTPREQFEGPILGHLRRNPRIGAMTPGELLLWNFTPAFFGRSEDTVISRKGEKIYEANYKALDKDQKGSIRVGDLYRAAERICAEAGGRRAYADGRILAPNGTVASAAQGRVAPSPPRPTTAPASRVVPPPIARPVPPPPVAPAAPPQHAQAASILPGLPQAVQILDAQAQMSLLPPDAEAKLAEMSPQEASDVVLEARRTMARAQAAAAAPQPREAASQPDAPPSPYGMQFKSGGPEDDDATTLSEGDENVIERFRWTIQYDTTPREGRFVQADNGVEMRYAGIDGAMRRIPVDLAYNPPSLDEVPPQLKHVASVSTEVGWAARALLGWLTSAKKPYGTVIPFDVGGEHYAARVEKHSNAPVGVSVYLVASELSSGGPDLEPRSFATGILLAAVKADATDPAMWTWVRVEDDLEILVMNDALKCEVGGTPHVRAPVSWAEMREVARLLGCVPPLKEWVDAIYAQATFHPTFVGLVNNPGDDKLMNTVGFVLKYHQQLEAQLAKAGIDTSTTFVEPIAKWWIFSDRMPSWEAKYGVQGVAGLYGSLNTNGTRIQPDSAVHDAGHSDYSMVARLVSAWGRRPSNPGEAVDLIKLMQERKPQLAAYIELFRRES